MNREMNRGWDWAKEIFLSCVVLSTQLCNDQRLKGFIHYCEWSLSSMVNSISYCTAQWVQSSSHLSIWYSHTSFPARLYGIMCRLNCIPCSGCREYDMKLCWSTLFADWKLPPNPTPVLLGRTVVISGNLTHVNPNNEKKQSAERSA
jgi:hypothetical protein